MAGRIKVEDIALVKERASLEDAVREHVTLRPAGPGSLKGLCPFHDEKSPSFNIRPAVGAYHCLAGETRVLTWEGPAEIRDLAGGTHKVLGRRGDWVDAPFKAYGVQRLYRITLTRNRQRKELYATDGHRWFLRSGAKRDESREVLTTDLTPGARLVSRYPRSRIASTTLSPFGIAHGFTYGDGTRNGAGSMALVCPPKDLAMLKWFPNSHTSASGDNLLVHHLPGFFKSLPPLDESVPYLYGWLAGYFAADGCVAADGTVIMNSADRTDLEFFRTVCTRLGIGTYGITTQSRLGFGTTESDLHRLHIVNDDLTEEFFLLGEHQRRFVGSPKKFARRGWVVESVEPTDRVEEVYCAEVADGHAFTLEDNILTGNCFGCGEGGDVIEFVMKVEHLSFTEAIERLAGKAGIELHYEDGPRPREESVGKRSRLIEAHRVAAEYFSTALVDSSDARAARDFLRARDFNRAAAEQFGVGYAPRGFDNLANHLRDKGFSADEIVLGGLAGRGQRGLLDKFRGRLVWPIRDITGDTIGFGARRLYDDDRIEAKYLNTAETPIYKKTHVLYGLDLAKKAIAKDRRAVVVEGYTDVMACHLSGVDQAVATCGTSFGIDHIKTLRRIMRDEADMTPARVVYTFDGDAAGQKAAMRAFGEDQRWASQSYVAVAGGGQDPCDLRQSSGEDAVRHLIDDAVPMFEFAVRTTMARFDLSTAEGRVQGMRAVAPIIAGIRDTALRPEYTRTVAGWLGLEVEQLSTEVSRASRAPKVTPPTRHTADEPETTEVATNALPAPDLRDPIIALERQLLQAILQYPSAFTAEQLSTVEPEGFSAPAHRAVYDGIVASGGFDPERSAAAWVAGVTEAAPSVVAPLINELSVASLPARLEESTGRPDDRYLSSLVLRVQEVGLNRKISDAVSTLRRQEGDAEAARSTSRVLTELHTRLARLREGLT